MLGFLTSLLSAAAIAIVPAPTSEPTWISIGKSSVAQYDILSSTIEYDFQSLSIQFLLRTVYTVPEKIPNQPDIKFYLESTLVQCAEDQMITMNQVQYGTNNKSIATIVTAKIYKNDNTKGSVISEIILFACGPRSKKKEAVPGIAA